MSNYFIVNNKPDDYGNCQRELVKTSLKNATRYYNMVRVSEDDALVLQKYMEFVDEPEEKQRTDDERFYGTD